MYITVAKEYIPDEELPILTGSMVLKYFREGKIPAYIQSTTPADGMDGWVSFPIMTSQLDLGLLRIESSEVL